MVPPYSVKITRVPTYLICIIKLFAYRTITYYGQTFQNVLLSSMISAVPLSLAATDGISVDFCSSGYLDVSVPRVRLVNLCIQFTIPSLHLVGCPIRKSSDITDFVSSPKLIADLHVLHRLLPPRHPPYALSHLTI